MKYVKIKGKKRKFIMLALYYYYHYYALGPKYAKILNMAKLCIWQGSQYASATQRSEYARVCLRVLNTSGVQNMPGFSI